MYTNSCSSPLRNAVVTSPFDELLDPSVLLMLTPSGLTRMLLEQHDSIGKQLDEEKEDEKERTTCNKDTGNKRRIQKWTRGEWFCVGGGGVGIGGVCVGGGAASSSGGGVDVAGAGCGMYWRNEL